MGLGFKNRGRLAPTACKTLAERLMEREPLKEPSQSPK